MALRKTRKSNKRSLMCEALESRQVMSADGLVFHNFRMPEDSNNDGSVSPLDALIIINQINKGQSGSSTPATQAVDVNADGTLSPLDVLVVVNYINKNPGDSANAPSQVNVTTRINKLEQAIATKQLPNGMDLASARDILQTLEAGGHPECGDKVINGQLAPKWDHAVSADVKTGDEVTESVVTNEIVPEKEADDANDASERLNHLLSTIKARLQSLQVATDVIATITTEISDAAAAGLPLTIDQIKATLTELKVDVAKVFPSRVDAFINRLTDQLAAAGVNSDVIKTISTEVRAGFDANKPLTFDQIRTRLSELGVDVAKLFPTPADKFISDLSDKLKSAGVSDAVIATISADVRAAFEARKPLTLEQIKSRLTELGVDVNMIFGTRVDERITELAAKLKAAGITETVVTTIISEYKASIQSGKPLTLDQIRARLIELGVDVSKLFPPGPNDVKPTIDRVVDILTRAKVRPEVITIVKAAMNLAFRVGTPLTVQQILDQLKGFGVTVSSDLERILVGP